MCPIRPTNGIPRCPIRRSLLNSDHEVDKGFTTACRKHLLDQFGTLTALCWGSGPHEGMLLHAVALSSHDNTHACSQRDMMQVASFQIVIFKKNVSSKTARKISSHGETLPMMSPLKAMMRKVLFFEIVDQTSSVP